MHSRPRPAGAAGVGRVSGMEQTSSWAGSALALGAAVAGVAVVLAAVARGAAPLGGPAVLTIATGAAVLLTPLFAPTLPSTARRAAWCAALVAGAVAGAALVAPRALALPPLAVVATTAFAWSYAAATCLGSGREPIRLGVLATLILLCAAPLYLGPWVARLGSDSAGAQALLSASPMVELAAGAGCDVLRSPWLYRVSVLGSLRFSYPATGELLLVSAALCLVPSAVRLAAASARRHPFLKSRLETPR
jgi:hypothetical protein